LGRQRQSSVAGQVRRARGRGIFLSRRSGPVLACRKVRKRGGRCRKPGSRDERSTAGAGPPVILLHCSSSHSGQWKALIEALQSGFRCLAPDLHGYGRSDGLAADGRAYGPQDAAIVAYLLDQAGAPAHLVGHSLGGTVALRAALEWPDKVRSLTLIEPVLFGLLEAADDPDRIEYLQIAHDILVLMHFGRPAEAAQRFTDFWMGPGAFDAAGSDTQAYIVDTMPRVADDWLGISRLAPDSLGVADPGRLAVPCHLVESEHSRPSVKRIMELLRGALPEATCSQVPGAGHMAPVTHPERTNAIVAAFLRGH